MFFDTMRSTNFDMTGEAETMSISQSRDKGSFISNGAARRDAAREAAQLSVLMVNGWRLV